MRTGLVISMDLERYSYESDAKTLVRVTEGTIPARIPPRLAIREKASLELPHIMVLFDDPERTVLEPLTRPTLRLKQCMTQTWALAWAISRVIFCRKAKWAVCRKP